MTVIRQLKGIWGLLAKLRIIAIPIPSPRKFVEEQIGIGLPLFDPPPPEPPHPPNEELAARAREVIGTGTVEERAAFDAVSGSVRRITGGAPREPRPAAVQPSPEEAEETAEGDAKTEPGPPADGSTLGDANS